MNAKILLCSVLLSVLSLSAYCQDMIYKRDGSVITVIVKEVGDKSVIYKKYDNQSGPNYAIAKTDIERIKYQNGTEDIFDAGDMPFPPHRPSMAEIREKIDQRRAMRPKTYEAPNIIAIAPLQISDNGIGIGASYERSLDKTGIIAFYLPVYFTWNVNSNDNGYYTNNQVSNDPMFYAAPGIKIYPTGNQGRVKYAVGPSIVLADGTKTNYDYYVYNPYGGSTPTYSYRQNRFMMGVMVINSLNINPTPKIYLGLELGLGGTYINKKEGVLQEAQGLEEFSFRIGYRF